MGVMWGQIAEGVGFIFFEKKILGSDSNETAVRQAVERKGLENLWRLGTGAVVVSLNPAIWEAIAGTALRELCAKTRRAGGASPAPTRAAAGSERF
jgi:hypothetical protein